MTTCPECNGTGQTIASHVRYANGAGAYNVPMTCHRCNGHGEIEPEMLSWIKVGEGLRQRRIAANMNMRQLALAMLTTAVDVSQMEHGRSDPARLAEYWRQQP